MRRSSSHSNHQVTYKGFHVEHNIDRVKERVAKLLAMAADTASPEEAAIAAGRARKLMDLHQLSESDIGSVKQDRFDSVQTGEAYKYMPQWKQIIATQIAQYNDCQATTAWATSTKRKVVFSGYSEDVAMCVQMFASLCAAVESWCKLYMKSIGHGSYYMASIGNPYKYGMAQRINSNLGKLMAERDHVTMGGSGKSLVVVKTERVQERFGAVKYGKSKARVTSEAASRAHIQGWVDGDAVSVVA